MLKIYVYFTYNIIFRVIVDYAKKFDLITLYLNR